MKYLVLRPFKSYGVFYHKGDIVTADKIKSLHLRLAEGKVVAVVEESAAEEVTEQTLLDATEVQSTDDAVLSSPLLHAADEESLQEPTTHFSLHGPAAASAANTDEELVK